MDIHPRVDISIWAKTIARDQPGISVHDHCINVGCVAEALLQRLGHAKVATLPEGAATLAALHDFGKISTGFQAKCWAWLEANHFDEAATRERWLENSESDHAKVGQHFLKGVLKSLGTDLWAVGVGVHHGRIFGRRFPPCRAIQEREEWMNAARQRLMDALVGIFGTLPNLVQPGTLRASPRSSLRDDCP